MKNLPLILAIMVALFVGCEGPEGPTGAKGKDGADGNANVVVTTKQVNPNNWIQATTFYYCNVTVSAITQDIVTYGSVFVYYSGDNATWGLLPSTSASSVSGDVFVIDYLYTLGNVQLQAQRVVTNSAAYPGTTMYLKVVTVASMYLGKHATDVNWNDYNEVKRKLNLQE